MDYIHLSGILYKSTNYHLFGPLHLFTLAIIIGICVFIVIKSSHISQRSKVFLQYAIVIIALASLFLCCYIESRAPLHLCDMTTIILLPGVLIFRKKILSDILICYAAWGSLLAIITPGLNAQSQWAFYIPYFISHSCNVLTAIYAIIILGVTLDKKSIINAIIYGTLYTIPVAFYDYVYHSNYLYLFHKPPYNTLYNTLLPWPWYILQEEFIGIITAILTYVSIKYLRQYFSTKKQLVAH